MARTLTLRPSPPASPACHLWEAVHQGDPEMKAHIDDPLLAVKQVASATGLDLFNWKTEKRV